MRGGTVESAPGRLDGVARAAWPGGTTTPACPSHAGHRFPAEVIGRAVWLHSRFSLGSRHVDELPAARGVVAGHGTVRRWGLECG